MQTITNPYSRLDWDTILQEGQVTQKLGVIDGTYERAFLMPPQGVYQYGLLAEAAAEQGCWLEIDKDGVWACFEIEELPQFEPMHKHAA